MKGCFKRHTNSMSDNYLQKQYVSFLAKLINKDALLNFTSIFDIKKNHGLQDYF